MSETPTRKLPGYQRRYLRARAHALRPLVQLGDAGVSDAVVASLVDALEAHELVKVRLRGAAEKKRLARELAERSGAVLCGLIGHTVILYRPHPERPRIELPEREAP